MVITYTMVIDFARPYKTNTLLVVKDDANSRKIRFILMDNGKPFDTSDVMQVIVKAIKPDGSLVLGVGDVSVDEDENPINEITYLIPDTLTDVTGKSVLTLTLIGGSQEQLSTFEFYLNVRNELYNEDDVADEDDLTGLRDLLSRAAEAISQIEAMTEEHYLPNPYPLEILLDGTTYSYTGRARVRVDFGNLSDRIGDLETSFPDGCSIITEAIHDLGIATAEENDSPSEMADNIAARGDWQFSQGSLAGYAAGLELGHADVIADPRTYGLWSDADYQAAKSRSWTKTFRMSTYKEAVNDGSKAILSTRDTNDRDYVTITATASDGNITLQRSGQIAAEAWMWDTREWLHQSIATQSPTITAL